MPGFRLSKTIDAPLETVFDAFTDVDKMVDRIRAITRTERLTPGPVGLGTKFKETRLIFKKESTETFEFTAFEDNRRYELTVRSCGAEYATEFRFEPEGTGTRVEMAIRTRAISFFAKLMSPLAGMMMGMMKKCVVQDMDDMAVAIAAMKPPSAN